MFDPIVSFPFEHFKTHIGVREWAIEYGAATKGLGQVEIEKVVI